MSKTNMILKTMSLHRKLLVRAAQIGVRNISCGNALKKEKNLYEILGLNRDASQADIKNAYFELSKLYHPDRIAATDENLARFREVSAAYEVLGNEQSRIMYDKGLLGDLKGTGIDIDESQDPIVKFYKKRQEASKSLSKPYDDVEAWAQTYYTEAKKKASKKQELFQESEKINSMLRGPEKRLFQYFVTAAVTFLWLSNFEGTKAEKTQNEDLTVRRHNRQFSSSL